MSITDRATEAHSQNHPINVSVNERPVTIIGPHTSGLVIKQAAVAAGLPVQLDFVLSEEIGERKTKVIGDEDPVVINPHSRFTLIAPDDNS